VVQAWPALLRQLPLASQVIDPVQVSGSSALVTTAQAPFAPVQAWQVPQLVEPQQCWSTQCPLAQSVVAVQVCPALFRQVPPPSQVRLPVQVSASSPLVTEPQVPALFAQLWQEPVQALLQQCWSAQVPVTQSEFRAQVCPCLVLQVPVESQVEAPVHESGSSMPITAMQVPPPPVQAWHLPQALTVQQWPSTQAPLAQSVASEQIWPGLLRQLPPASQVLPVVQVSGSSMFVTDRQVPPAPVQAWQVPHAETPQQWPSMHAPDMHEVPVEQALPFPIFATHAPAELQYCVEGQGALTGSQAPAQVVGFAHRLLEQLLLVPDLQLPAPSQVGAGVAIPFVQVALPHMTWVVG
jgi:hypothetical protein